MAGEQGLHARRGDKTNNIRKSILHNRIHGSSRKALQIGE